MRVEGGKPIYGVSVGILMLDARFPRIPGDIGHAATWEFPVHYRIVRSASPDRVVRRSAEGLLPDFIAAAQALEQDGVDGITTNCGFLSIFQEEIAASVGVPVVTSSLQQVAMVNAMLPKGQKAGILTISASSLSPLHLERANVPADTPIATTEGGHVFTEAILGDAPGFDVEAAEADNVAAARRLIADHPEVGAIVLECTNMTPYARAIRDATGRPVFTMVGFVSWFQAALAPSLWSRKP